MDPEHGLLTPGTGTQVPGLPTPPPPSHGWVRPVEEPTDYMRVFLKRRWMLLGTFLGVFALAAAYTFSQPRVYRAVAKVQIVEPAPVPPARSQTSEERSMALQAHLKVLYSSLLAVRAVERSRPEHDVPVDEILSALSVEPEEPDALAIRVEHNDPRRAALIANLMQDAFIDYSRDLARADLTSAREFLEGQKRILEADLQRTEVAIKAFKSSHGLHQGSEGTDPAAVARTQMVYSYRAEAEQARAEWQSALAGLRSLRQQLASQKPTRKVTRVTDDLTLRALREEIATIEVELVLARARYKDTHPRVDTLKDRLTILRDQEQQRVRAAGSQFEVVVEADPTYTAIQEQVREQETRVATLRARASALASTAAARAAELPGAPTTYVELAKLEQAKASADKAYGSVMEQLTQARLNEARQQGPARRLDIARTPRVPIRPRPMSSLAMAMAAAMVAAVAVVVLQESANTNVDDPDALMRGSGIRTLGLIPTTRDARRVLQMAAGSPASLVAEAFRMAHASLTFAHRDVPLRTVMITSAGANEGKSFAAVNLATVFAQTGAKTLLVDADLRRPMLHHVFGHAAAPGLSNVLVGELTLQEAVRGTDVENLEVLPTGDVLWNPPPLLGSARMGELIEEMKEHAQVVILDTPPALAVADAVILAPHADATILVVAQGKVPCRALVEIRSLLEGAGGWLAGAIFNKVRRTGGDWYTHYYYSYHSKKRPRSLPVSRRPDSHSAPIVRG